MTSHYSRFAPSYIVLRAVKEGENIISFLRSKNIAFCVSKIHHSDKVGISLKTDRFMRVRILTQKCRKISFM